MLLKAATLHQFTFTMNKYNYRLLFRRNTQLNDHCTLYMNSLKTINQELSYFYPKILCSYKIGLYPPPRVITPSLIEMRVQSKKFSSTFSCDFDQFCSLRFVQFSYAVIFSRSLIIHVPNRQQDARILITCMQCDT